MAAVRWQEEEKMRKDLTELVFILDKSGSMSGLESDTIGGFNAMIEKQKKVGGAIRMRPIGAAASIFTVRRGWRKMKTRR